MDDEYNEQDNWDNDRTENHVVENTTKLNYHSYMNRQTRAKWSKSETDKFYEVFDKSTILIAIFHFLFYTNFKKIFLFLRIYWCYINLYFHICSVQGLQQFGSDFAMIQHLFPDKSRNQVRQKFKAEEKKHPMQVHDAIMHRSRGEIVL